ncbi:MAG: hypothetical protein ACO3M5_08165 [Saprospiraceae bacterium]|jgi:hypothetical protein|nr:hypothetical protein [Chitinophagia bacterium]
MKIKNLFPLAFVLLLIVGSSTELDAQRRGTKKRESKETTDRSRSSRDRGTKDELAVPLRDRIIYDIQIGQLGFNQGFQVSMKSGAAYKFTERLSLGLGLKMGYFSRNLPGNSQDGSFFDYGAYLYPRFKISESFYIKGEYQYLSIDRDFFNTGNAERQNGFVPLIGAGYVSGFGPWKFGLELLIVAAGNTDQEIYFNGDPVEYMFTFVYNF